MTSDRLALVDGAVAQNHRIDHERMRDGAVQILIDDTQDVHGAGAGG
jgi:hypothetical protein